MPLREQRVAVVGASGQVGRTLLHLLAERGVPVSQVEGFASSRSYGLTVSYGDNDIIKLKVLDDTIEWSKFTTVFFAVGNKISSLWASRAVEAGCLVIDKSSFFRLDSRVPLVVPEVNGNLIPKGSGLVSTPNCIALPLILVLDAIQKNTHKKIASVVVSTYQSVSGAGQAGMVALDRQTHNHHTTKLMHHEKKGTTSSPFPRPIAFNVIPQIGDIDIQTGMTGEEEKVTKEVKKVLDIPVSITCVRVPVFVGHSMSVHIRFEEAISAQEALTALSGKESIFLLDGSESYTTPVDCVGLDEVHVSRVRVDESNHGIILWVVCDNLRKGAALNAIQIAEFHEQGGENGSCTVDC